MMMRSLKEAMSFCNVELKVIIEKILDAKEKGLKINNKEIKYVGLCYDDHYNKKNSFLVSLDYNSNETSFELEEFKINPEGKLILDKVKYSAYNYEVHETVFVKSTLYETIKSYNERNYRNGDILILFFAG